MSASDRVLFVSFTPMFMLDGRTAIRLARSSGLNVKVSPRSLMRASPPSIERCREMGLAKSDSSTEAVGLVKFRHISAFSRQSTRSDRIGLPDCSALRGRRMPLLVAGGGRRSAGPALEGVIERGRTLVTEKPCDLRQAETRLFEILERKAAAPLLDDLGERCPFFGQPARLGPDAEGHRLCDRL